MLVISRKIGDQLYIGNDIVITILNIDRFQVSLGIDAPSDIRILRNNAKMTEIKPKLTS